MSSERVLFIVHARYPVGEPRIQRQAAAAVDAGMEADVVCLREEGEKPTEVVDGVGVHRLPVRHERSSGAFAMALEYLRFMVLATVRAARLHRRRRYDVVHVSNPPDLLVVAGLLPKLTGARLVLDVHDLTPDLFAWRFAGSWLEGPILRALALQERVSCRLADELMTVHDACAEALRERSVGPARPISIVMNSLDERLLPASSDHRPLGAEGPARIVYHGSLTELYGVHVLIDALAQGDLRRRATLQVIGHGDALDGLRRQAASHGLDGVVSFSGRYVAIEEALARVSVCDIGVVPLTGHPVNRFSLPSKLFEYVALGLPVVCARTENIARHFGDDELAFFRPGDASDLAARLSETLDDPSAALRRAERARERYQEYRWPASRERLVAALGGGIAGGGDYPRVPAGAR